MWKQILWYLETALFVAVSFAVALRPDRVALAAGRGIGRLFFALLKGRRRVAIENIAASLPFLESQPGWRGGATYVLDPYSSITAQYTMFEASTDDELYRTSGIIGSEIQGLVFHPTSLAANSGGIFAEASQDLAFDLIDLDYRELISSGCYHQVTVLMGARYANLEQQFAMRLPNSWSYTGQNGAAFGSHSVTLNEPLL